MTKETAEDKIIEGARPFCLHGGSVSSKNKFGGATWLPLKEHIRLMEEAIAKAREEEKKRIAELEREVKSLETELNEIQERSE